MRIFISCLLLVSFISLLACCDEEAPNNCPCLNTAYQGPHYRGCGEDFFYGEDHVCKTQEELYKTIYETIVYPAEARENHIDGIVKIEFDILESGALANFRVVSDTILGYGLEEAALEGARALAANGFCPARQDCEPVVFSFTLPILFVLPG